MGDTFYRQLEPLGDFSDIFEDRFFHDVPGDWWVILTDVVGSTMAIEAGRYKDVNSAGSLSVIAIGNLLGDMDFPFIFGGDGMTCLIPGSAVPEARKILGGVGPVVRQAFGLDLRLAMVPVSELKARGGVLRIARWRVSPHYVQAIIEGDGIDIAEELLKADGSPFLLELKPHETLEPDLSGYSCRWQDFPSAKDETIALMVKFRHRDRAYLREFLRTLDLLVGQIGEHHPLPVEASRGAFSARALAGETAVATGRIKGIRAGFYRLWVRTQMAATLVFSALGLPVRWGKKDLSQTKKENIASSDYKKYDNTLRMVLSVTKDTRIRLETDLEHQRSLGRIYYGLHVSDRAILTCLIQSRSGDEVHFVDAADGGYAYAARQMKRQIGGTTEKRTAD